MSSFDEDNSWMQYKPSAKFLPVVDGKTADCPAAGTTDYYKLETPIFSKRQITLRIPSNYKGNLMHVAVNKRWLICVLDTQQTILLRFFLPRALPPGEIALEKYLAGYAISKVFLDYTGHHTLIPLVPQTPGLSADFLYIHANGPKVRRVEKFKDHEITSVAFNRYMGTESSTGPILLGTSRGLIFETELVQDGLSPLYRKQVYDLGLGRTKYPITGLELLRLPNTNRFMVIATAPDCIYTFQENCKSDDRSLQFIFANYVNGQQIHGAEMVETELSYSVLQLYGEPNEKLPKQWAWLCGSGIRFGEISTEERSPNVLLGDNLISLDYKQYKHLSYEERRQNAPRALALTEYHALLLYSDHITGICLLNEKVVYEEFFHEQMGKLLGLMRDPFTGTIYVYTDKMFFNFKITDEQRDIWRIYLEKGQYDLAEIYAAEQPEHLDTVLTKKADAAFKKGDYNVAADFYAETTKHFEQISLKFMKLENKGPIIRYVKKRLAMVGNDPDTISVLVVWLIDLYLTQINYPRRSAQERAEWQSEFDEFMQAARVADCARQNKEAIRNLLKEHADVHNISQFAIANGDYEEVIDQQIGVNKFKDALHTLTQQDNLELYYKYCPILMEYVPHETIATLMSQGRKLDIKELIPTLIIQESEKHIEEIIRYLEYAIYKLGETHETVHNYIIHLYAKYKPSKVIIYLENEGQDLSLIHYEINYAMLQCQHFHVNVATVFLMCLNEMWAAAVELALTFDLKLAKETASKPQLEEDREKMWLVIAQHEIQGTNDVKKALDLLKECELLRIEDLLPFFSDFEKIDDFKEAICEALRDYNQKILELKHEMDECDKQAMRVLKDLQNCRARSIRINAQETCNLCETFLLVKPFFVFVCGHKFHSDCIEKQILPTLSRDQSHQLATLKQQLETLLTQSMPMDNDAAVVQIQRAEIKTEIENIIAADCYFCGVMIEMIDQPFVSDWDQVNVDWD
ncbi:LOW QUALITY PROTEIN: vacuolar protein sorting-associated protein 18 homolog [Rhagoletis pomonella]|uniref:LOW QUALITY PROTEIN: vacuolar protein sorting-associated protein 18 homolog n=1 Tax=Rhagoletis pomonella TaxID=28610 RepID=UPI00177ADDBA|nr:LOW QUALITY PROTEIN: vacuolar protein sorting-associated protein 18 homolog [Rhagoletis pomonella]